MRVESLKRKRLPCMPSRILPNASRVVVQHGRGPGRITHHEARNFKAMIDIDALVYRLKELRCPKDRHEGSPPTSPPCQEFVLIILLLIWTYPLKEAG